MRRTKFRREGGWRGGRESSGQSASVFRTLGREGALCMLGMASWSGLGRRAGAAGEEAEVRARSLFLRRPRVLSEVGPILTCTIAHR